MNLIVTNNVILASILQSFTDWIKDELIALRLKSSVNSNLEYVEVLKLLTHLKFETDFRLVHGAIELQKLYDEIRLVEPEESNIKIRFLLDCADYLLFSHDVNLTTFVDYKNAGEFILIDILAEMLCLHSGANSNITCYDQAILESINDMDEWKLYLVNNAWLVSAIMINKLPSLLFMELLLDYEKGESKNETRSDN